MKAPCSRHRPYADSPISQRFAVPLIYQGDRLPTGALKLKVSEQTDVPSIQARSPRRRHHRMWPMHSGN
jgi:hypothetical protein